MVSTGPGAEDRQMYREPHFFRAPRSLSQKSRPLWAQSVGFTQKKADGKESQLQLAPLIEVLLYSYFNLRTPNKGKVLIFTQQI